ncbi:DALR anticodon-binding domain-containing protein [Viridibacillus sp. NPDC093762]|uniref:DALR anticodon-binding domain-containing protein n=1 Tax=Viridibacillus sp. NPDC093762 TaxID=3390720 RepID=UPI003D0733A7
MLTQYGIKLSQLRLTFMKTLVDMGIPLEKQGGVGAVIFNDLKNDRLNDIEFSLEQMMNFEGETGPYVQYTFVRITSLLEKGEFKEQALQFDALGKYAWSVIQLLEQYPVIVQKSFEQADPSQIANFSLQLARAFNK